MAKEKRIYIKKWEKKEKKKKTREKKKVLTLKGVLMPVSTSPQYGFYKAGVWLNNGVSKHQGLNVTGRENVVFWCQSNVHKEVY